MKKFLFLSLLGMASLANASQIEVRDIAEFSDFSKSNVDQSPRILSQQLALVDLHQTKGTVLYILGKPHFKAGLMPAKKWEYRFNVVNGKNEVKECAYAINFDGKMVDSIHTPSQLCIDILKSETKQAEPVADVAVSDELAQNVNEAVQAE